MSSMCMWKGRRRSALYGIYWWELQLPFDMILFTQDRISTFILCVYLSLLSITDQGVHSHGLIQSLSTSFSISLFLLPGRILNCFLFFIASLIHFIESLLKEQTPLVLDLRYSTSKHHGFFVEAGRMSVLYVFRAQHVLLLLMSANRRRRLKCGVDMGTGSLWTQRPIYS